MGGRLWWCPSGLLTYFPLYAAAPLESNLIQSYTPTLNTLIQANAKQTLISSQDEMMTAVGVAEVLFIWGIG
jgi:hypothetical protein